jgi:hypothetical protein
VYAALVERFDLAAFTRARFRQEPYEALRHFSRSLEEFFEMLAMTSIWTALLRGGGAYFQGVRLVPAKREGV